MAPAATFSRPTPASKTILRITAFSDVAVLVSNATRLNAVCTNPKVVGVLYDALQRLTFSQSITTRVNPS